MIDGARYAFSLYAVPTAATSILMLVFGTSLLLRRPSRLTAAFFGLTAAASLWLFAFTFLYCSLDERTALFWARMAYAGVPLIAPAIYQFTVEMLHIGRPRRTHALIGWLLGIVFVTLAVPTSLLVTRVQHFWWGYYPRYGGELTIPFLVFFFGYLVAALGEFVVAFPAARGVERQRIRVMIAAFAIAYLGCVELTISIAPIVDDGEAAGAIMIGRDMRERKEAERQIRRALGLLESTLECTADGILVIGAGGRVLTYNQRFVDMWRIPPNLVAMADDRIITSYILEQIHDPDDYLRTIDTLYQQPEAESFDLLEFKDGRRFERYSIGRAVEGAAAMRVWSFRDVTARFTTESALRESELRYRLLFEQNAAGVCVTTFDGIVDDCNSTFAAMLGCNRTDLIGQSMAAFYVRPVERG